MYRMRTPDLADGEDFKLLGLIIYFGSVYDGRSDRCLARLL